MSVFARAIVESATKSLAYADRLLQGIAPATFARFPSPAGTPIHTNHPAFVYGHLAIYPAKFLENAGRDPKPLAMPQRYTDLFAAGVECQDDPQGTIYPAMEEIVANCRKAHNDLFQIMSELTDADLSRPPANERSRAFLPSLGALGIFYFSAHTMMHLGQVSAWRRCMGLPPAQ